MIRAEFDESEGCYYLSRPWEEKNDDSLSPQAAAAEYQKRIRELGARQAVIPNEMANVAAALLQLPGFQFERKGGVEFSRSCPTGVEQLDRIGVRQVTVADEPEIYAFLQQTGLIAERREDLQRIFEPTGYHIFLTEAGRDVAFASVNHGNGEGWISYIAVLESERQRGLGRRMMELLMAEADRVPLARLTLSVRSENIPAVRLYERLGFVRSAPPLVWVKYTLT